MARLSDIIEDFIKEMLEDSSGSILELQRNELASTFNCAPSQINYVLMTRFTIDRGYYIESRRGGGGCIRIKRIQINKNDYIKESIWHNIGNEIGQQEAEDYVHLFEERGYITTREASIMKSVINEKTLALGEEMRDALRAQILKTMLITVLD